METRFRINRILICHLGGLLLALLPGLYTGAFAQEETQQGQVLFILDASGSMWGQVEGREKIVVAKDVMTGLIKELPEGISVGLQAYGHRSKGDCDDIELIVPPASGSKDTVIDAIQAITPKGKTPITNSFKLASKTLEQTEGETTVVLISDGKETCSGDPCELVGSLRDRGINVRVHVVGFDVGQDERDQLVCIATAGDGQYFTADNAEQLQEALTEVRQQIVEAPPPVAIEPEPPQQAAPVLQLYSVLSEGGEPITGGDLSYRVFASKDGRMPGKKDRPVAYSYDARPSFELEPGDYVVEVKYGSVQVTEALTLEAGQPLDRAINLKAGYLRLDSAAAEGAEPLTRDLSFTVYPASKSLDGKRKRLVNSYDASPLFKLPAGDYVVVAEHGQATAEAEVSVVEGELSERTLVLNVGYLRLRSIPAEGADPLEKDLDYRVFSGKKDLEGKRKQLAYSYDAQPLFKLPQGNYLVRVKHGEALAETEIDVQANELTEQDVDLNVGYLRLQTLPAEGQDALQKGLKYLVFKAKKNLEGTRKKVSYSSQASPLFKLTAGDYHVTVSQDGRSTELDVTVNANELTEKTLTLPASP